MAFKKYFALLFLCTTALNADYLKIENAESADWYLHITDENTIETVYGKDAATNFTIILAGQNMLGKYFWVKYQDLFLAVKNNTLYLAPKKYGTGASWTAQHTEDHDYKEIFNEGYKFIRE